jgi:7-carboxy-7-deazaguanine synthase
MMSVGEIFTAVDALRAAPYMTLTGGDPCIHKGLGELIIGLNVKGMKVAVETQGEIFADWLPSCDVITFSPKGPSSGNIVNYRELTQYLMSTFGTGRRASQICIKIVCFTLEDFQYAMEVYNHMPSQLYDSFYFTAGTPMLEGAEPEEPEAQAHLVKLRLSLVVQNMQRVAASVLAESKRTNFNEKVHIGCQQHVLLWPDKHLGV